MCVRDRERAVRQGGGEKEKEGAHRETGEGKKKTSGWLRAHERREFGNRDIMLQQSLCVHVRGQEIPHSFSV